MKIIVVIMCLTYMYCKYEFNDGKMKIKRPKKLRVYMGVSYIRPGYDVMWYENL